jgi:hypothetical protein
MISASSRAVAAATVLGLVLFALLPRAAAASPQQARGAQPSLLEQMRSDAKAAIAGAVSAGRPEEALGTYDRFFASVRTHDFTLLLPVAKGVLAGASADQASLARIPALERLARAGDVAARGTLESTAGGRDTLMPGGVEADCALARIGDSRAVDRLIQRLGDEAPRDKGVIITALTDAGAKRAAYAIVPFLTDDNPSNRLAAIQALAALGSREHVAPLRAAFDAETHPGTRQYLAMALHSLGSSAGDALLAQIESIPVPDVRLVAMEAYHASKSPKWTTLARQLLRSSSESARLRAAFFLGLSDAEAAAEITRAAGSTNTPTREVAAKLLESAGSRDTTLLVKLLHDRSAFVRSYAAGALLAGQQ